MARPTRAARTPRQQDFDSASSQHEEDATPGAQADGDVMGQEQSREERQARSAALHTTAAALIHDKDGETPGRLKRPSKGRVAPVAKTQRGIKGAPRADLFDVAPSPDKLHQVQKRRADTTQAFSPTKKQARAQSQTLAEREAEDQRLASAQLAQSDEDAHDDHGGNTLTTRRRYKDFFSDAQVKAAAAADEQDRTEGQATSEKVAAEEDGHAVAAAAGSDAVEASTPPARRSPRKKQNALRSQRQINTNDAGNIPTRTTRYSAVPTEDASALAAHPAVPQSSTPNRGRGRPRKTDSLGRDKTRAPTSSAASAAYVPQPKSATEPSGGVKRSTQPRNGEASTARSPPSPSVAQRVRAAEQERKTADGVTRLNPEDVPFPPGQNDDDETEHTSPTKPAPMAPEGDRALSLSDQDIDRSSYDIEAKSKGKPRKESQTKSRANTSVKRGPAVASTAEILSTLDDAQRSRLFGFWPDLVVVIRHAEAWIAEQHRCDDDEVKKVVRQCRRLIKHFKEEQPASSDIEDYDPETAMKQIAEQGEELSASGAKLQGDAHTDRGDDIFANLVPVLVKLLEAAVGYYERRGDDSANSQISPEHELRLVEMMQFVRDVGLVAYDAFNRHPGFPVKSNIRSGIIIPLRQLSSALQEHQQQRVRAEQALVRATQEQALRRQREQREQRLSRQAGFQTELENKWKSLHWRRSGIEGNPLRFGPKAGRAKINHLAYPDYQPEFDSNGERFERMQVFSVRIGPTQPAIDRAREVDWTMAELDALQGELKAHSGEHVFEEIISRHCGPKGLLNRFNVTEIVVKAADLRAFWEERQLGRPGVVDDWVKAVPVWTRPLVMAGQENEWTAVSIEDDVDIDGIDDDIEYEVEVDADEQMEADE